MGWRLKSVNPSPTEGKVDVKPVTAVEQGGPFREKDLVVLPEQLFDTRVECDSRTTGVGSDEGKPCKDDVGNR